MTSETLTLRLGIVSPSRNTRDSVQLEQEPWDTNIGRLTQFGVLAHLNTIMFGAEEPESYCAGPTLAMTLYAYPSRPELNYQAACSWGTLGARRVQELDYTEVIQINLELERPLQYPALEIVSYAWDGPPGEQRVVYTAEGEAVDPPAVSVGTDGVRIARKIYGTLVVTYRVCRHTYPLSLISRPDAKENKLQSFAFAVWDGGNSYIEITAPEGAENDECNNRGGDSLDLTPEDKPPDHVDPENEYVGIDYCTGLEIAE